MKNYLISGLVAAAVAVAVGFLYFHAPPAEQPLGAVSSLDGVDYPFTSIAGNRMYYSSIAMSATSSVPCSLKNPFNATSTLRAFSAQVSAATFTVNNTFDLATSTSAFATTSPMLVRAWPQQAGSGSTLFWQPATGSATLIGHSGLGFSDIILGPNDYVNLRIATGTAGTQFYTGRCTYQFQKS